MRRPSWPWALLAKIMAAKAAAAKAVAATAAGKSADKKAEKEDPDRAVGYILQLSANQFTLKPGAPAALTVTVWAANADGSHSLAGDAQIRLTPSINLPGLRIEPSERRGTHPVDDFVGRRQRPFCLSDPDGDCGRRRWHLFRQRLPCSGDGADRL